MTKLNLLGIKAAEIDRIIDKAILRIGSGGYKYSCCALARASDDGKSWAVRRTYTRTFGPVMAYRDNYGYAFATEVSQAANSPRSEINLRILLLSLFRAAWRDLV